MRSAKTALRIYFTECCDGTLLLRSSYLLSGDLGVTLCLTAGQILTHLRETGTCGDELTDDDILLQTGQRIDLALDGGLGQHAGGLLEGGGRQEGLVCQSLSLIHI